MLVDSGFRRSFRPLINALVFILFSVCVGTYGYMKLDGLALFDSLYFTIVTLTTIGFGDITPVTHEAKVFTIFFVPLGVSAFLYTFGAVAVTVFEGRLMEVLKVEQTKEKIDKLRDHTILCGLGDTGSSMIEQVTPLVVIEKDEEALKKIKGKNQFGIVGDSTRSEVLEEAGVARAKSIVITLDSDPDVVFTILTAKELNHNIKIYAKANKRRSVKKMRWAGAHYVVCLSDIGARELLNALEKQD